MPHLRELRESMNDSLVMISLSTALSLDSEEVLRNFAKDFNVSWYIGRDEAGIGKKLKIAEYPTIIILDKNGVLKTKLVGVKPTDVLISEVTKVASSSEQDTSSSLFKVPLYFFYYFAGVLALFAPCAFPMLPAYMSYFMRTEVTSKKEDNTEQEDLNQDAPVEIKYSFIRGILTSLGIIFVFMILGIFSSLVGEFLSAYIQQFMMVIGGVIIILGLMMYFEIEIPMFKPGTVKKDKNAWSFFYFGMLYGLAALSCVAPLFISIMIAAISGGFIEGVLAFGLFSLGIFTFMLGVTWMIYSGKEIVLRTLNKHLGLINKITSLILVFVGMYIIGYSIYLLSL